MGLFALLIAPLTPLTLLGLDLLLLVAGRWRARSSRVV
jgi:hypothetical protein